MKTIETSTESVAYARLIAAAPELLANLKLACEVLRARGEAGIAGYCEIAIASATAAPHPTPTGRRHRGQ